MRIVTNFPSSEAPNAIELERARKVRLGSVHLVLNPTVPMLEITTDGGATCVLSGEDLGRLTRWLTEEGFKG